MGLFSKKNEPTLMPPEPLPVISEADLVDAERIMNQWDASMGNSDAVWNCLEAIGRRGGFKGGDATMREMFETNRDTTAILNRPWRWWNEAARAANSRSQDALAGRIFLFTHMFVTQLHPGMNAGNEMETGLVKPADQYYKEIAALAVDSMSKLDPSFLIHDTATGKVDVANAIGMAEQISGVTAPSSPTTETPVTPPVANDGSQWNSL